MKKFYAVLAAISFLTLGISGTAVSQTGIYSSADVLERDAADIGAALVVGSVGLIGSARYGATPEIDIGARAGIINDVATRFYMGIDARYAFMRANDVDPADVNFLGAFQLDTGKSITGWFVGAGGQFGKTFPFSGSDMTLAPYGGVILGVKHTGSGGGVEEIEGVQVQIQEGSANDFGGLLPLGAELAFQENLSAMFELDVFFGGGTDVMVALGINYAYK